MVSSPLSISGTGGGAGGSGSGGASRLDVQEVIIYPVAIHQGTTEIADDGSAPAYAFDTESTNSNAEGTSGVHWSELIDFEHAGTISVQSIFAEFEFQTKFTVGVGDGVNAFSKIQMTNDGGITWQDVTDSFSTTSVTYVNRVRAGVGRWFTTITAGSSQIGWRLVGWTDDSVGGAGRSTAESQIRTNSYIRITYKVT